MSLEGRCLCGAVTYASEADPLMVILCHCRDCQRQSGAAASYNVVFPRGAFELGGETLTKYETANATTGEARERWFCRACGSPLVTYMVDAPDFAVVKGGTLDDPWAVPAPQAEIWGDSAHEWWTAVEGRNRFERDLPRG